MKKINQAENAFNTEENLKKTVEKREEIKTESANKIESAKAEEKCKGKGVVAVMKNRIRLKRVALLSVLIALAMVLSYLEALIPPIVAIPGVKLGLANSITLFALYSLGVADGCAVSVLRVLLSSLLFGNAVGLAYSASGAVLSLLMMILTKRVGIFSSIGVSVVGGVSHNIGQVLCAMAIMETAGLITYLAPLLISGTLAGIAIGAICGLLVKKTQKTVKKYLKN